MFERLRRLKDITWISIFFFLINVFGMIVMTPEPALAAIAISGVAPSKISVSGTTYATISATGINLSSGLPKVTFYFNPAVPGHSTYVAHASDADDGGGTGNGFVIVPVPARPVEGIAGISGVKIATYDGTITSAVYNTNLAYTEDPVITNVFPRVDAKVTGYVQDGNAWKFALDPANPSREMYLEGTNLDTATWVYAKRVVNGVYETAEAIKLTTTNFSYGQIHFPYASSYMNGSQITFEVVNSANARNSYGQTDYSLIGVPSVTSFDGNPNDLVERQNLTINGTGFWPTANSSLNKVIIDDTTLTDDKVSSNADGTALNAIVPNVTVAGSGKSMTLRTYKNGGIYRKAEINYSGALTINKRPPELTLYTPILPNRGKTTGGDTVLMAIKGYDSNTQIFFGSVEATTKSLYTETPPTYYGWPTGSDIKYIQVTAPPSVGYAEGRVDIRVQNSRYPNVIYNVASNAFMYSGESQFLQVSAMDQPDGPASGGTNVIVSHNFVKFRSNTASSIFYIPNGRYVQHSDGTNDIVGTPVATTRDSIGSFVTPNITVTGTGLWFKEVYPNYMMEGTPINLVVYSQIRCFFGSAEAKITKLANTTNPQAQDLYVTTGSYTLGENELAKQVDVKVSDFEYMYKDDGQFMGPPDDLPFSGFDSSAPRYFTYKKALTNPVLNTVTPNKLSWKSVGAERKLVLDGYDFFSGMTVTFTTTGGTYTVTDNGSNMVITTTGERDSSGRFRKLVTINEPPDILSFASGATQAQVSIRNWDNQTSNSVTITLISAPKIESVQPGFGPDSGGMQVAITGSEFYYNPIVSLRIGGIADIVYGTNVIVLDENSVPLNSASTTPGTKIVFDLPDASGVAAWNPLPQNFDASVYNVDDGTYTLQDCFKYFDEPSDSAKPHITSMTPTQGLLAGGTDVTITGSGFKANAVVSIDGVPIQNPSIQPTRITGKTPKGRRANVKVPVQVVNQDDGGMDIQNLFMYFEQTSSPTITSMTPAHGSAGIKITLRGTDFHYLTTAGNVYLAPATVTMNHPSYGNYTFTNVYQEVYAGPASADIGKVWVKDSTTIELIVPNFVVDGSPRSGACTITVRNRDNTTINAPSLFQFQVPMTTPDISTIEPAFGSVNGGNLVTVTGKDFLTDDFAVFIGGKEAETSVPVTEIPGSDTSWLQVETPAATRNGPADVMVLNYDGGYDTLPGGFNYVDVNYLPVIKSISASTGPSMGGQSLTIIGQYFQPVTVVDGVYYPRITIGGVDAIYDPDSYRVTSERLVITTPPYTGSGEVDLIVTNPDGGAAKIKYSYSQSKPAVTSITPDNIANKMAPTYKILKGTGFMLPTTFNGQILRTRAYLLYPGGSASPTRTIEIVDGITQIQINDTISQSVYNIEIVSSTLMKLALPVLDPSDKIGAWTLRLKNPDGGLVDVPIQMISIDPSDLPKVTLPLTPNQGTVKGGTQVEINGANFQENVKVQLKGVNVTKITRNDTGTKLTITTPPGVDPDDLDVAVDVAVMNPDGGQCYIPGAFTYRQPESVPVIDSITPATGPAKGGTEIVIAGKNFKTGLTVLFDTTILATGLVNRVSALMIKVTTPAHTPGAVSITVRNTDFGEATKENGYTYTGSPDMETGKFKAEVVGKGAIRLSWPAISGVTSYELQVSKGGTSSFNFLADVTGTEYYLTKVEAASYYFRLRTVNAQGVSTTIDANPFPLRIVSTDIEEANKTAPVQDFTEQTALGTDGKLTVAVGKDITASAGTIYAISLSAEQRKASRLEVLIPVSGVDQASAKTVTIEGDKFGLYLPLSALNTFEYTNQKVTGNDAYFKVELSGVNPRILESASLNRGKRAMGGFNVAASIQGTGAPTRLSYFNARPTVNWDAGSQSSQVQAAVLDRGGKSWISALGSAVPSTTMYGVSVEKPDNYIFFSAQRTR